MVRRGSCRSRRHRPMTGIKLEAIRGRHHRVCTFCGGSPDDPHQAEWRDFYTCSCRDALCPQQLLDVAEARERALREALDDARLTVLSLAGEIGDHESPYNPAGWVQQL